MLRVGIAQAHLPLFHCSYVHFISAFASKAQATSTGSVCHAAHFLGGLQLRAIGHCARSFVYAAALVVSVYISAFLCLGGGGGRGRGGVLAHFPSTHVFVVSPLSEAFVLQSAETQLVGETTLFVKRKKDRDL